MKTEFRPVLVCVDCLHASANGFENGFHSPEEDYAKFTEAYVAAENRTGGRLIPECSEPDHSMRGVPDPDERTGFGECDQTFSWNRCEWCHSHLGGSRHCATVAVEVAE
jgi:hypothetical protein